MSEVNFTFQNLWTLDEALFCWTLLRENCCYIGNWFTDGSSIRFTNFLQCMAIWETSSFSDSHILQTLHYITCLLTRHRGFLNLCGFSWIYQYIFIFRYMIENLDDYICEFALFFLTISLLLSFTGTNFLNFTLLLHLYLL